MPTAGSRGPHVNSSRLILENTPSSGVLRFALFMSESYFVRWLARPKIGPSAVLYSRCKCSRVINSVDFNTFG